MKQKKQVLSLCAVFVLVISGFLYWIYRHPDYHVQQDGILTADSGIAVSNGGAPIPKDIEAQSGQWAKENQGPIRGPENFFTYSPDTGTWA